MGDSPSGTVMNSETRIHVAGHRGLVGSAILRRLEAGGYRNIITATRDELDLRDPAATLAFYERERPEVVYLAAAKVGGIVANATYPADFIRDNLAIALSVIEAARAADVDKLVNLGSSCVYPKFAPQPMSEDALLTGALEETNEPYAIAKIAAIKLCAAYNRQYGTDYISLMPTNLFGLGDTYDAEFGHVLPSMIAKFHAAKVSGEDRVVLWGDGTPRREFMFADDVADAAVYLAERFSADEIGEFINVGSGQELTIAELATVVRDIVYADAPSRTCKIVWDDTRPSGTPRKLLDTSRLTALGWQAKTPLVDGIRMAYDDYRARS